LKLAAPGSQSQVTPVLPASDQPRPDCLCNSGGGAMTDPRSDVTPPEIFNPEILLAVYISFNTTLAIQV